MNNNYYKNIYVMFSFQALSWLEAHERRRHDDVENGIRQLSLAIEGLSICLFF